MLGEWEPSNISAPRQCENYFPMTIGLSLEVQLVSNGLKLKGNLRDEQAGLSILSKKQGTI